MHDQSTRKKSLTHDSTLHSFQELLVANREIPKQLIDVQDLHEMLTVMVQESPNLSEEKLETILALHDQVTDILKHSRSTVPCKLRQDEPLQPLSPSIPQAPFTCPICYEDIQPNQGYILCCNSQYCKQVRLFV